VYRCRASLSPRLQHAASESLFAHPREWNFNELLGEYFGEGSDVLKRELGDLIDKQNWQNINRVRVNGSGSTNYAVVKDHLGNWYMKSYSSDPKAIIDSARGLALFNIGGKLGTDLVTRAATRAGTAAGPDQTTTQQRSAVGKASSSFRDEYDEKIAALFNKSRHLGAVSSAGLFTPRNSTWLESALAKAKALDPQLDVSPIEKAHTAHLGGDDLKKRIEAAATKGRSQDRSRLIVEVLRGGRLFRDETVRYVRSKAPQPVDDNDVDGKKKRERYFATAQDIHLSITQAAKAITDDHREALLTYEQQILVLNKAID
jgi:hypothetical protein